jgi:hypothetical protein
MQAIKVKRYGKVRFRVVKGGRAFKRPYATHYYTNATDRNPSITSNGACASEEGAIRASAVRIFMGQYGKCKVVDRTSGAVIYTVARGSKGFDVRYGDDVPFKVWRKQA